VRRPTIASRIRGRIILGAIVILFLGQVVEAMAVSPDFLAYFNELAGGPDKGYQHLLDSSLDWGQDLAGLGKWLDTNNAPGPQQSTVYLSYFGNAPPEYYGIHPVYLPGFPDLMGPRQPPELGAGLYCISANLLQSLFLFDAPGAWSEAYETRYQNVLYNLRLFDSTASDPQARAKLIKQTGAEFWPRLFFLHERLRFARLTAFLRKRKPDATIGHTIFVYRLTDDDVSRALRGPMP
jgi:hypothetical protein